MHQDQRPPPALSAPPEAVLELLAQGDLELQGRMPWSSNYTFLAEVRAGADSSLAVYKPGRGERPLWDFPDGLYRREAAAWVLSEQLGWGIVPPTVVRDGPLGEGSVQQFMPADFSQHYLTLFEDPSHHDGLRTICAFDLLANNTDRKSGHTLLGQDRRLWAIDNGLCFHPDPKLRTVIWEFGGEPVPDRLLVDVERMTEGSAGELDGLLHPAEVEGIRRRGRELLRHRRFPEPDPVSPAYPWPLV